VINVVCDNALLTAFVKRATRVSPQMVDEAARDLSFEVGEPLVAHPAKLNGERSGIRRLWPFRRAPSEAGL
jgi:hypothetical protein